IGVTTILIWCRVPGTRYRAPNVLENCSIPRFWGHLADRSQLELITMIRQELHLDNKCTTLTADYISGVKLHRRCMGKIEIQRTRMPAPRNQGYFKAYKLREKRVQELDCRLILM